MGQVVLIILISLIAAMVVGSTVFFVWTFLERLTNKTPVAQNAEEAKRVEKERTKPAEPENG
jgi:flagellar basal body-associated protein FliL